MHDYVPDVPEDSSSFVELHIWFKHMFEHYGWMLLASAHHDTDKVAVFLRGVDKLVDHIAKKYSRTKDQDRKDDLAVLYKHAKVLQKEAHTRF